MLLSGSLRGRETSFFWGGERGVRRKGWEKEKGIEKRFERETEKGGMRETIEKREEEGNTNIFFD